MKKLLFCTGLALTALVTACVDKNELVDEDSKPAWLGGSIYEELENPNQTYLTGSFNNYLNLVKDLGYAETLSRTGSKTVFPANDEAFDRFFQNNTWGVSKYEDLTDAQKKLLLYSSMLNNAMLVNMLPNVPNGDDNGVMMGEAVKHATDLSVTDTIQWVAGSGDETMRPAGMPANNSYWTRHWKNGLFTVSDASVPMMVHLTREYMLNNNITTAGDESDFAIITGSPYTKGTAYIFGDKIINPDITCLNGYIHQMEDVIVPPGNLAQVLRSEQNTHLFSRLIDYFAAPYYDETTTKDYRAYADAYGYKVGAPGAQDSIFQVRYLSKQTGHTNMSDPDRVPKGDEYLLAWDPGWNQYSQRIVGGNPTLTDIGAIFAPTDQAVKNYFLPGGAGAFLLDIYGSKENTEENLEENLDALQNTQPKIISSFVRNLMKESFAASVPSKFATIQNDAKEYMGITKELLQRREDDASKYDIKIANNGVVFKLNELIVPDEYQSVCAPSSTWDDMRVMDWAVQDGGTNSKLGVDFKFYLMAMNANLAFFIPDDKAFGSDIDNFIANGEYFVNPTSLGKSQPEVLRFFIDTTKSTRPLACESYRYNPLTGEVTDRIGAKVIDVNNKTSRDNVASQLIDILNYHTVVLGKGETIGQRRFYKTKHGGAIYVPDGDAAGKTVLSGQQLDSTMVMQGTQVNAGNKPLTAATIEEVYNEKNGRAYRLDHAIQSPVNSVYATLKSRPDKFSKFFDLCQGFGSNRELLNWAGISSEEDKTFHTSEQDRYIVFTASRKEGTTTINNACLDANVKMFNTYNYTLYAPNDAAMTAAEQNGLPTWDEVSEIYEKYANEDGSEDMDTLADIAKVKAMIDQMREFVRYHFQSVSVYADKVVDKGTYNSLYSNALGQAVELEVTDNSPAETGGDGIFFVKDGGGFYHKIDANARGKMTNRMAREFWFDASRTTATSIYTSSFCAIHEIDQALCMYKDGKFNHTTASAIKRR